MESSSPDLTILVCFKQPTTDHKGGKGGVQGCTPPPIPLMVWVYISHKGCTFPSPHPPHGIGPWQGCTFPQMGYHTWGEVSHGGVVTVHFWITYEYIYIYIYIASGSYFSLSLSLSLFTVILFHHSCSSVCVNISFTCAFLDELSVVFPFLLMVWVHGLYTVTLFPMSSPHGMDPRPCIQGCGYSFPPWDGTRVRILFPLGWVQDCTVLPWDGILSHASMG